jgi:triosephosphate isomerase
MARTPLIAGNWKMNKTVAEALRLVEEMIPSLQAVAGVEKLLCPPATSLMPLSAILDGKGIALGAQNLYWEKEGAYTGELSAAMVAEFCQYVIIGHSERRALFGENDQQVQRKVQAALAAGLRPVLCVGETLEENEAGRAAEVVSGQLRAALDGVQLNSADALVIAYEPVWAIGTGRNATPEQAQEAHTFIRHSLRDMANDTTAERVRIQYGGSVKPENARELMSQTDIDGALVGGASLDPRSFAQIVKAAREA